MQRLDESSIFYASNNHVIACVEAERLSLIDLDSIEIMSGKASGRAFYWDDDPECMVVNNAILFSAGFKQVTGFDNSFDPVNLIGHWASNGARCPHVLLSDMSDGDNTMAGYNLSMLIKSRYPFIHVAIVTSEEEVMKHVSCPVFRKNDIAGVRNWATEMRKTDCSHYLIRCSEPMRFIDLVYEDIGNDASKVP